MEPLTEANSWLEVKVKREGEEAAWEKLDGSDIPEDVLAAFVQDKHRSKAIPLPGETLALLLCFLKSGSHLFPTTLCLPAPSTCPAPTTPYTASAP